MFGKSKKRHILHDQVYFEEIYHAKPGSILLTAYLLHPGLPALDNVQKRGKTASETHHNH